MRHSVTTKIRRKQKLQNKLYLAISIILVATGVSTLIWMGIKTSVEKAKYKPPALVQEGIEAPQFKLPTLDGEQITLSDYRGRIVVMNMWATWCPPCRAEMPGLNRFYEAHKDEGVIVLAVNGQEPESVVRPFIAANNFTFPILLDLDGAVGRQYMARSFPTTFVIDGNGRIRHTQVGEITEHELEQIIRPLLK